jgi:hypothetical protein
VLIFRRRHFAWNEERFVVIVAAIRAALITSSPQLFIMGPCEDNFIVCEAIENQFAKPHWSMDLITLGG